MARERRSSTLPSKSIKALDVLLVGLLTYASSDSSCLPRKIDSRWHNVALILALTVAGQWRIFTALPIYQEESFIRRRGFAVNGILSLPQLLVCPSSAPNGKFAAIADPGHSASRPKRQLPRWVVVPTRDSESA